MRGIHAVSIIRPVEMTEDGPTMTTSRDELLFDYLHEWKEALKIHAMEKNLGYCLEQKVWNFRGPLVVDEADVCTYFMNKIDDDSLVNIAHQILESRISKIVLLTQQPISMQIRRALDIPLQARQQGNLLLPVRRPGRSFNDHLTIEHLYQEPELQRRNFLQLFEELLDD